MNQIIRFITNNTILLSATAVVSLLLYELWEDLRERLERYWVKGLLKNTPQHLNVATANIIQNRIATKDNFKFIVVGDTQKTFKKFKMIIDKARQANCDFIIHVGDATSSGRYRQYMKLIAFLKRCGMPVIFGIGNHDINNRGYECFAHLFGPIDFFFDCKAYRFIFVNNTVKKVIPSFINIIGNDIPCHFAVGLDECQINRIDELLRGNENSFVIMHLPPDLDTFNHHSFKRNSDRFLAVMQKNAARVARVFSGHIHGYAELLHERVQYIVTGGAGEKLHAMRDGITNKFNYVLVNVAGDKVTHTVQYMD
jgi:3',5'-cyclic AMP phosphodiesterase CpdA